MAVSIDRCGHSSSSRAMLAVRAINCFRCAKSPARVGLGHAIAAVAGGASWERTGPVQGRQRVQGRAKN